MSSFWILQIFGWILLFASRFTEKIIDNPQDANVASIAIASSALGLFIASGIVYVLSLIQWLNGTY